LSRIAFVDFACSCFPDFESTVLNLVHALVHAPDLVGLRIVHLVLVFLGTCSLCGLVVGHLTFAFDFVGVGVGKVGDRLEVVRGTLWELQKRSQKFAESLFSALEGVEWRGTEPAEVVGEVVIVKVEIELEQPELVPERLVPERPVLERGMPVAEQKDVVGEPAVGLEFLQIPHDQRCSRGKDTEKETGHTDHIDRTEGGDPDCTAFDRVEGLHRRSSLECLSLER